MQTGFQHYFLRLDLEREAGSGDIHSLSLGFEKSGRTGRKKIKENNRVLNRTADLVGKFICVLFLPGDLVLVEGGPAERRKFFDLILSQFDPLYLQSLLDYNRVLKQRGQLLRDLRRRGGSPEELNSWDQALAQKGSYIQNKRTVLTQQLRPLIGEYLKDLSGQRDDWTFVYRPSVNNSPDQLDCSAEFYLEVLRENRDADLRFQKTGRGIHLDKILFLGRPRSRQSGDAKPDLQGPPGEDYDMMNIASQGQKRTLVLALRLAQYSLYREVHGVNPVLLIDDVITELDPRRRLYFIRVLKEAGQTFFTTTTLEGQDDLTREFAGEMEIFQIPQLLETGHHA